MKKFIYSELNEKNQFMITIQTSILGKDIHIDNMILDSGCRKTIVPLKVFNKSANGKSIQSTVNETLIGGVTFHNVPIEIKFSNTEIPRLGMDMIERLRVWIGKNENGKTILLASDLNTDIKEFGEELTRIIGNQDTANLVYGLDFNNVPCTFQKQVYI